MQSDLANTFARMIDVEQAASSKGREGAIRATRDFFYKGDLAEEMVKFCNECPCQKRFGKSFGTGKMRPIS